MYRTPTQTQQIPPLEERERMGTMSSELQNHGETSVELQKGPRKQGYQKMTLEQYIDFFNDDKQLVLTINVLRQIILIHRFKLIQRVPKDELMDTVRSIDLMEPARSTINGENISSCAFITLQDVIKDLSILKWQECCITSLQTHNSVDHDNLTLATTTTTVASTCSNKSKSKRNSKKNSSSAAASVATDHSAQSPTFEQLEMEPRLSEVDCDISSAIVVPPAPDGGGTENQPKTRKRKRKPISASMAS